MRRIDLAVFVVLVPALASCNQQPPVAGVPTAAAPAALSPNSTAQPTTSGDTADAPETNAAIPAVTGATPAADAAAPDAAASQVATLDGQQVIRQVAEFYRAKKTFQVDYEQKISMDFNGMKNTAESKVKITVERPNRIAIRQENAQLGVDVVCDGEQIAISVEPLKKYSQAAAPKSLDELLTNPLVMTGGGARGPLLELFSDNPYEALMQGVTKAEHAGREKIGDFETHHLKLSQDQLDWELWVAAGDEPRVVQVAFDMKKLLAGRGLPEEQIKDAKMVSVQHYKNWQFDAQPAVDAFAFEPPAGATKVDSFFEPAPTRAEPETSPLVGKPAPDVELELLDGGRFSLKEQKDKKIVILDFWATWCGPCVQEMPLVAKVAEEYRDKDVALFCLNLREDADTIRSFLDQKKLAVTVSLDPQGETGVAYGVSGIPMLVLIDKAGVVQSVHVGFSPDIGDKLKQELDAILAGKNLAEAADAPEIEEADLPTEGLEEAWSKPGLYSGVAVAADGKTIVAINGQAAEFLDAAGNISRSLDLAAQGTLVRCARLKGEDPGELLLYTAWIGALTAIDAEGGKLWEQASQIDDVWAADLDGDGKDEVIVGYNGNIGLHVFGSDGERRWKDTSIGNVWHVTAGDLDGDGALEVVTTSAAGKVHVFDATGKNLATHDPGIYANMARVCRAPGESADTVLVIGGSGGDAQMVALDGKGQQLWQANLPRGAKHCDSLAFAPGSTWAAAGCRGGTVCVMDVGSGKLVAVGPKQGKSPQVAWATADGEPLLVVATESGLTAWRVRPIVAAEATPEDAPANTE